MRGSSDLKPPISDVKPKKSFEPFPVPQLCVLWDIIPTFQFCVISCTRRKRKQQGNEIDLSALVNLLCRYGLNQATTARIRNLPLTVVYTSYETMIKFTLLLMVFFLLYEEATFSVPPVDESKIKSWNVERGMKGKGKPDTFSVTMKSSSYHCYHEWCGAYFSAGYNFKRCGCDCDSNFPSFIPSMKTCINASQARSFGGMCYNITQLLYV